MSDVKITTTARLEGRGPITAGHYRALLSTVPAAAVVRVDRDYPDNCDPETSQWELTATWPVSRVGQ